MRYTLVFIILALLAGAACLTKQATHKPEADALLRAARDGHADVVKTLLSAPNADVNAKDEHGNTALMEAARFGHDDVVKALLIARADVRAKNDVGKTALMLAVEGGHDDSVRLLKQAGATE